MSDLASWCAAGAAILGTVAIVLIHAREDSGEVDVTPKDELDTLRNEVKGFEARLQILSEAIQKMKAQGVPNIYEHTQKEVLGFNRLLQVLDRCDDIKAKQPDVYDRNNRGRELIRLCNRVMDELDRIKPPRD